MWIGCVHFQKLLLFNKLRALNPAAHEAERYRYSNTHALKPDFMYLQRIWNGHAEAGRKVVISNCQVLLWPALRVHQNKYRARHRNFLSCFVRSMTVFHYFRGLKALFSGLKILFEGATVCFLSWSSVLPFPALCIFSVASIHHCWAGVWSWLPFVRHRSLSKFRRG